MTLKEKCKIIGKKHGVHWKVVRDEMQQALEYAYEDPNRNILNVVSQSKVEKKGEIPTVEEFLRYSTTRLETEHPELVEDYKSEK